MCVIPVMKRHPPLFLSAIVECRGARWKLEERQERWEVGCKGMLPCWAVRHPTFFAYAYDGTIGNTGKARVAGKNESSWMLKQRT